MARTARAVEELSADIALADDIFVALLPEFVSGSGKLWDFGIALGRHASEPEAKWAALAKAFAAATNANSQVLRGFVKGLQETDPAAVDRILDAAVDSDTLGAIYPELEANLSVNQNGVSRLHRALALGRAPIESFRPLAWGRASDAIPPFAFRDLVAAIGTKPGGNSVALEIVSMRLLSDSSDKRPSSQEIIEAGRSVLANFEFVTLGKPDREDHELGAVAQRCLSGPEGATVAGALARKLMAASHQAEIQSGDYNDLLAGLLRVHPHETLDEFFSGGESQRRHATRLLQQMARRTNNPLDAVADETLLAWSDVDPNTRYPLVTSVATLFKRPDPKSPQTWATLASALLTRAPEPQIVMLQIANRLRPSSWSGSLAVKLESRLALLRELPIGDDAAARSAHGDAIRRLQEQIDRERAAELADARAQNRGFE
jgi:hypothetical protein